MIQFSNSKNVSGDLLTKIKEMAEDVAAGKVIAEPQELEDGEWAEPRPFRRERARLRHGPRTPLSASRRSRACLEITAPVPPAKRRHRAGCHF